MDLDWNLTLTYQADILSDIPAYAEWLSINQPRRFFWENHTESLDHDFKVEGCAEANVWRLTIINSQYYENGHVVALAKGKASNGQTVLIEAWGNNAESLMANEKSDQLIVEIIDQKSLKDLCVYLVQIKKILL